MEITLESLGLTQADLQERIVERCADQLLSGKEYDEDGNVEFADTKFKRELEERVRQHASKAITALFDTHVAPKVTDFIETLTLQETNKWGEKTGKPVTFIEYLVSRADAYIREDVNHDGKSKEENRDSYSGWSKSTTRIAYMINRHLQYSIQMMVEGALKEANKSFAGGIEQALKTQLAVVLDKVKVGVKVGS